MANRNNALLRYAFVGWSGQNDELVGSWANALVWRLLRLPRVLASSVLLNSNSYSLRGFAGWGLLTFPAFLEELERLGLKGQRFGPGDYARALEAYLGIAIKVVLVNDGEHPDAARAFVGSGRTACVWYDDRSEVARIFVLSSLPPVEMTAAIYHELGHLAAGHPLMCVVPTNYYTANLRERSPSPGDSPEACRLSAPKWWRRRPAFEKTTP